MNRVEAAIQEGRCVIAVGGRALQNPDVLMELRRRAALPSVALGADAVAPVSSLSAEALAPVLADAGGVLVLVEPDAGDGRALGELERMLKDAKSSPRLVVAARAWNPFSLPMGMRLLKTEQVKQRAQDFLGSLPTPPAAAPAAAPVAGKPTRPGKAAAEPTEDDRHRAARVDFIAREDEKAALVELLGQEGGAIVVSGPAGVGRRWLVETALQASGLPRLPDLTLGRGIGADTLLIRLAIASKQGGDPRLHQALSSKEGPAPAELAALVADVLSGSALSGKAMVVHGLEQALDRRDGSLYREGRLELILRAILTRPLSLRLVFTSEIQPELHAEGLAQHIRRVKLLGLPGRELHALFAAWHAPEFPREHFGPISERVHGHPIAARTIAIDSRTTNIEELIEQPRYLKAQGLDDHDALGRSLERRIKELPEELAQALCAVALLRDPGTPEELTLFGIKREVRIDLLARGLMEQTPEQQGRRYYVHPLVAARLDRRMVEDFGRMELLGNHLLARARDLKKEGDEPASIALALEGNRLLVGARRARSTIQLPYPDLDATVDDIRGMVRRKKGRLDIARMRLNEVMKQAPRSPELLLADAELMVEERAGAEQVEAAFHRAQETAPTPEAFHREATWQLDRGSRGKAADALRKGLAAFPENARMRRRLAGLLMQLGKLQEAAQALREALDLEPMMPDTYSLLGEVYVSLGQSHWEQAEQVLAEARALAPDDPRHGMRHALLLHARGAADPTQRSALWEQAEELARAAWQADQGDLHAAVLQTSVMLDRVEALDATRLDQCEYILRETMKKRKETPEVLVQRARVLIHREAWREAEELIDRALAKHSGMASAFMARGELWEARHQPFHAFEAWKAARARTQPETAERFLADEHVLRLQTR